MSKEKSKAIIFRRSNGGDPDVFITTPFQQFNVHSQILKMCSGWFSASMSKEWWTETDTGAYRYVLDVDKNGVSTLLPQKHQLKSFDGNAVGVEDICQAFQTMFHCFYRQPIQLRSLERCLTLVMLADQYDALDSVAESIRASFFEWPELDTQIMNNSTWFLILGYKLQSLRVFNEAFIHVVGLHVGQHKKLCCWIKQETIPEPVVELVKSECFRLDQSLARVVKDFLLLGTGSSPYERILTTILKDRICKIFTIYQAPGQDGTLFRKILTDSYTITTQDLVGYKLPQNTFSGYDLINHTRKMAPEIKAAVLGFTKNNLRLKEEMVYLTCAELPKDVFPL